MITRISLEHFKSIEALDLPLGPLNVIVGPNGSGKSNFVDAIRLLRDAAEKGLDYAISERHGIDSVRQWSPSRPYNVTFSVEVATDPGKGELDFTLSSARGQHRVQRESGRWVSTRPGRQRPLSYERRADGTVVLGSKYMPFKAPEDELFLGTAGPNLASRTLFPPLIRYFQDIETYSIFPNTLRTPQKPTNDVRLSSSGDNLTSVFKALTRSKRTRNRDEIVAALRQVMPQLDGIRIQSLGGLMVPIFRVQEANGRKHDFNVSQISDGTLRLLGLLTALYQPSRPRVIAMEEPEQTVNPGVLAVLAEAVREVSESGTQVLLTTHSPHLVDHFEPDEIFTAELIDGKTVIQPIDATQKQAVKDRLFSLGELMTVEGLHG